MKNPLEMQNLKDSIREEEKICELYMSPEALITLLDILESYHQEYNWDWSNEKLNWISRFVDIIEENLE